jgi:WD40 repeat protein
MIDEMQFMTCSVFASFNSDVSEITENIHFCYCSHSGDFVLFGMENGVVRIHPVHGKNVLDSLTTYWTLHAHDSQHGKVTAIRTSFDDRYVFTVGADGNFFVYNFMSDATLKESRPIQPMAVPKIQVVHVLTVRVIT